MDKEDLRDSSAEKAIISGCIKYGSDVFVEVEDLINENTFVIDSNQIWYKCLRHLFEQDVEAKPDIPSLLSSAKSLGLDKHVESKDEQQHLRAILNFPVDKSSIRKLAVKIRKLEIARAGLDITAIIENNLSRVKGDETTASIISLLENPIDEFVAKISYNNEEPKPIGEDIEAHIYHLGENPVSQMGLPSGFRKLDKAIGGGLRKGSVTTIGARSGVGKAQPLDSLIQTPSGPIKMGDIKIGDIVCTPSGITTKVKYIHPQGKIPTYKIIFRDGDSVEASGDHLWKVKHRRWKKYQVLTTDQLKNDLNSGGLNSYKKWTIDLPEPSFRPKNKNLNIDPYILGCLIGDGCICNGKVEISSGDKELLDNISIRLKNDYYIKPRRLKDNGYGFVITKKIRDGGNNYYIDELRKVNLFGKTSHNKFIPKDYILSSINQRRDLLRGLLDTDGGVDSRGNIEYSSVSKELIYQVKDLVESLGGLCHISFRYTKCNNKKFPSYRANIRFKEASQFFLLTRKKNRCRTKNYYDMVRRIENIEYIGKKECQCIQLDNEEKLYLTNNHIITHNSHWGMNVSLALSSGSGYEYPKFDVIDRVPVLVLDTEMGADDHKNKNLANLSGVLLDDIETGQFGKKPENKEKVLKAGKHLSSIPYYMKSIAGQPFEETLSIMKRWIKKEVGLNGNGHANDCLIVLDYIKLMDSSKINNAVREFQEIGFMMTALHNFAVKYQVPILTFVQLNRDGIDSEDTDGVSLSDRILWLTSNLIIYKVLDDEELGAMTNSKIKYTHKAVILKKRHGKGLAHRDYILIKAEYGYGRITEGPLKSELEKANNLPVTGEIDGKF